VTAIRLEKATAPDTVSGKDFQANR